MSIQFVEHLIRTNQPDIFYNILNSNKSSNLKYLNLLINTTAYDRTELSEYLIKHKYPVNIQDSNGLTPLHYAISYNNLFIIKLLLENGADPNKPSNLQIYPINIACKSVNTNALDIIYLLLKYGAKLPNNISDINDQRVVSFLSYYNDIYNNHNKININITL